MEIAAQLHKFNASSFITVYVNILSVNASWDWKTIMKQKIQDVDPKLVLSLSEQVHKGQKYNRCGAS